MSPFRFLSASKLCCTSTFTITSLTFSLPLALPLFFPTLSSTKAEPASTGGVILSSIGRMSCLDERNPSAADEAEAEVAAEGWAGGGVVCLRT